MRGVGGVGLRFTYRAIEPPAATGFCITYMLRYTSEIKKKKKNAIEFKEGAPKAIDCKIYPIIAGEDEKLQEFIVEQKAKGYICPSPYASPFFFVKKEGKLQPIQNYQKLNEYTIKDKYPLSLIPELIAEVQDTWIFSNFDISWG